MEVGPGAGRAILQGGGRRAQEGGDAGRGGEGRTRTGEGGAL